MAKKKIITKTDFLITGIADKGMSVGRDEEGQVIFLNEGIPGDIVDITVKKRQKKFSSGIIDKYKKLSQDRVVPICQHFGVCGGCKWQNMSYSAQLHHKYLAVTGCIQRIAKEEIHKVLPIIGCEENYYYRNKLVFSFSTKRWLTQSEVDSNIDIENNGALGFHKSGFYEKIVEIHNCHLQHSKNNDIRNEIRNFITENGFTYYDIGKNKGLFRNLEVRNTSLNQWMVTVVFGENNSQAIKKTMSYLQSRFPEISSLYYIVNEKKNDSIFDQEPIHWSGQLLIIEKLDIVQYKIGPKSFFQTNPKQAEILYNLACNLADFEGTEIVYDLYTGLGSIALYIANKTKKVVGIEEVEEAIHDAILNKELNNIQNVEFYVGDVKNVFDTQLIDMHGLPDVIITDPPRAGMHEDVIKMILSTNVPKIIYISCNPSTQARDISILRQKYILEAVQPVDMFPHTHHIESIALLTLRND